MTNITTKTCLPIVAVNFTFSLAGGMWVKREKRLTSDGEKQVTEWVSFEQLTSEVGERETYRLYRIAYHNGMCGMWYSSKTGNNCFENGSLVCEDLA